MAEAIKILRREHAVLWKLLDVFEAQLELFNHDQSPDYDVIQAVLEYCLAYPDQVHHPKEDLIYARMQARLGDAPQSGQDIQREHEELSALTHAVLHAVQQVVAEAEMPRNWVDTTARNFLAAYRRHIEAEEQTFFPAALETLDDADWAEIDAKATDRDDPLFGESVEKRFEALRKYILDLDDLKAAEA